MMADTYKEEYFFQFMLKLVHSEFDIIYSFYMYMQMTRWHFCTCSEHLSYTERLKYIGLPSLQYRRLSADMVETFKILNNIDKVLHEHIFPVSRTATRGHNQKIYKKNCRTNIRKYSFSQRIVDMWNSLPKTSNRNKNSQHFQKPIKQPLDKSGDKILTRCLPTGGRNQPIKKGPRG